MLNRFTVKMLSVSKSAFRVFFPSLCFSLKSFSSHFKSQISFFFLFISATGEAKLVSDNAICVHMENSACSIFVYPVLLETARLVFNLVIYNSREKKPTPFLRFRLILRFTTLG